MVVIAARQQLPRPEAGAVLDDHLSIRAAIGSTTLAWSTPSSSPVGARARMVRWRNTTGRAEKKHDSMQRTTRGAGRLKAQATKWTTANRWQKETSGIGLGHGEDGTSVFRRDTAALDLDHSGLDEAMSTHTA